MVETCALTVHPLIAPLVLNGPVSKLPFANVTLIGVAVGVGCGVGTAVAVGVAVGLGVRVGAGVAVGVGVRVEAGVGVRVGVCVAVGVGVGVGVVVNAVRCNNAPLLNPVGRLNELLPAMAL